MQGPVRQVLIGTTLIWKCGGSWSSGWKLLMSQRVEMLPVLQNARVPTALRLACFSKVPIASPPQKGTNTGWSGEWFGMLTLFESAENGVMISELWAQELVAVQKLKAWDRFSHAFGGKINWSQILVIWFTTGYFISIKNTYFFCLLKLSSQHVPEAVRLGDAYEYRKAWPCAGVSPSGCQTSAGTQSPEGQYSRVLGPSLRSSDPIIPSGAPRIFVL